MFIRTSSCKILILCSCLFIVIIIYKICFLMFVESIVVYHLFCFFFHLICLYNRCFFIVYVICLFYMIVILEPSFCMHLNRVDEVLMALPSDAATKLWGVDKAPTNVLIEIEDGRTFIVFISEAKGKFFLVNGWSDVVTHLGLKTDCLVTLTPLDSTRFKLTYFVNGLSPTCFWTFIVHTPSHFIVIPECILLKSHDYTFTDLISTIYLGNKTFHVKVETFNGKVCFTNGMM
ncbi:putative transcription factor B3-Domain family [Helianthus anomalus]